MSAVVIFFIIIIVVMVCVVGLIAWKGSLNQISKAERKERRVRGDQQYSGFLSLELRAQMSIESDIPCGRLT